eukprot:TCALIF_10926-PA protein Name:"Protein of unknown function" AED:0.00 eAED:0.00 QI:47/1/1/1/1/1/2/162/138
MMADRSGILRLTLALSIFILPILAANNLGTVKMKYKKTYLNAAGISIIEQPSKKLFQYTIPEELEGARRWCSAHCSNLNFGSTTCNVVWMKEIDTEEFQCTLSYVNLSEDLVGNVVKRIDPEATQVLLLNVVDALHNE